MNDAVSMRLELIAAKAKMLAYEYKNGKLWPGDLERGLGELIGHANAAMQEDRR